MLSQEHLDYLAGRCITKETADRFGLKSRGKSILIPVGPYTRVYTPNGKPKIIWAEPLDDTPPPFPTWEALKDAEVIVAGEFDCMVAIQNGIKAVSGTTGEGSFAEEWADCLPGSVTILYDADESGRNGAVSLANLLAARGVSARIAHWPNEIVQSWQAKDSRNKGFDTTNFFQEGGTKEEFEYIIKNAQNYEAPEPEEGLKKFGSLWANLHEQPTIPTGLKVIDETIYGLRRQEMAIIAARPRVGKSTLAQQIAINVAKNGYRVAVFSLEMSESQVLERMLASESDIPKWHFERESLTDDDVRRLYSELPRVWRLPFYLDTQARLGTRDIAKRAREVHKIHPLDVIVIDYVQLLNTSEKQESRARQLAGAVEDLKGLAKELNCALIVLSQVNRAGAMDESEEPQLHHLLESGGIENHADMVIILWRKRKEEKEAIENKAPVPTHGRVAKNRNGPEGYFQLILNGPACKFWEVTE